MISRRLLRIKVLQMLFAYHKSDKPDPAKADRELFHSIDKTFELYHLLLLLIPELSHYASSRIDLAKEKKQPSLEDLNPNTKFINNRIIHQIQHNRTLLNYHKNLAVSWKQYPEFIRKLFIEITGSDLYIDYMASETNSYEEDHRFILKILSKVIMQYDDLYDYLEEQSIYWNDEVDFILGMIIKTLKKFKETDGEEAPLMEQFKNQDDIEFTKKLFRKSLKNYSDNLNLIQQFSDNWEIDRIAFMDILIMNMAITEFIDFIEVPVKVSLNEYIEISKYYSTNKSSTFINGVLDKIINRLKEEKRIIKQGRGLIGEV